MALSRLGIHREEGSFTLDGQHALLLPVLASCSLLVVFYLFASIQLLILGLVCVSSVAAIVFALHPVLGALAARGEGGGRWMATQLVLCGGRLAATMDQVRRGGQGVREVLGCCMGPLPAACLPGRV